MMLSAPCTTCIQSNLLLFYGPPGAGQSRGVRTPRRRPTDGGSTCARINFLRSATARMLERPATQRRAVHLLVEHALVALRVQQLLHRLRHEAPADPRVGLIAREVDGREHKRLAVRARLVGDPREDAALADRRLAERLLDDLLRGRGLARGRGLLDRRRLRLRRSL